MADTSGKSRSIQIFEIIVILFVVAGMLLILTEITTNVKNEWIRRQELIQESGSGGPDPILLLTLSREQYQQIIATPSPDS